MTKVSTTVTLLVSAMVVGVALADALVGESKFLCAPGYVTHCSSGGSCETGPPDNFGVPEFLRVDLEQKLLLPTQASKDEARTAINLMTQENGEIYLHGVDNGRAFTLLIDEASGDGSMAIVADGETATAFLSCTTG